MTSSYYLGVEVVKSLFGISEKENLGPYLANQKLFLFNVLIKHLYSLLAA